MRLNPDLWLAHTALGTLHERRWRWTQALAEYERAARTAPRNVRHVPALEPFIRNLDFAANIREQLEIVPLNPLVGPEHWALGLYLAYQRDAASAAEAVSLAPDDPVFHVWLAHAEGMMGRHEEALLELRRAEQLPVAHASSVTIANLAYAYAQNESSADARRLVDMLAARALDRRHQAGHGALAYLAIGNVDAAARALQTVIEKIANEEPDAGYLTLRLITTNIYSDPVLDQPEFVALRAQLRGR